MFIFPKQDLVDEEFSHQFLEDIRNIEKATNVKLSSPDIVVADMLNLMIPASKNVVFFSFIILFVVLFLDIRNTKGTIVLLLPVALGVFLILGFMNFNPFKIKLF